MLPVAGQSSPTALSPSRLRALKGSQSHESSRMYRPAPRPLMLVFPTALQRVIDVAIVETEAPMSRDGAARDRGSLQGAALHNGQCDVTAGEIAIGKPHPRAAEAAVISLLDMEARLEWHALERPANCLASNPERPRRQRYRALRSRAAELDGADDRAVTIDAAGAARAIETIKREKLAGYEAPRGIGAEAFRTGRAGCEQDQNHHCQSSNHSEASPVTFSDSDLLLVSVR